MLAILTMAPSSDAPPAVRPSRPWLVIATGGGLGYAPLAPGSWGAAAGLLLCYWLAPLGAATYGLALLATLLLGIPAASAAEAHFDRNDDGRIVIDEVAGQLLTLAPLAFWATPQATDPLYLAIAFLLFRILDIWKPGPVRWAEQRFRGGLGVMADDVVAGGLAAVALALFALGMQLGVTP